jgi:hypothetical protein
MVVTPLVSGELQLVKVIMASSKKTQKERVFFMISIFFNE